MGQYDYDELHNRNPNLQDMKAAFASRALIPLYGQPANDDQMMQNEGNQILRTSQMTTPYYRPSEFDLQKTPQQWLGKPAPKGSLRGMRSR